MVISSAQQYSLFKIWDQKHLLIPLHENEDLNVNLRGFFSFLKQIIHHYQPFIKWAIQMQSQGKEEKQFQHQCTINNKVMYGLSLISLLTSNHTKFNQNRLCWILHLHTHTQRSSHTKILNVHEGMTSLKPRTRKMGILLHLQSIVHSSPMQPAKSTL